ncbi:MAG: peptide-methionine (S)-S-oxide reductase MsrA [Bacteroidia bacterium]
MRWLLICLLLPMACTAFSNKGNVSSSNNLNEKMNEERITDSIVLGGGCFWCLDAVYRNMKGIEKVECGYSNGIVAKPTYKEVCTGRTECVEVVKVFYDSNQTNLEEILTVFWRIHDPTTLNRQGNDVGTQYRSGVYYVNEEQKTMALKSKLAVEESQLWSGKIVTEIVPLKDYSTAEDYHQDYFTNNPSNPYCTYVVGEKVEKFKKLFSEKIK